MCIQYFRWNISLDRLTSCSIISLLQLNPSRRARNVRQNFREACQFIRDAGRKAIEKQVDQVRKGQPLSRNVIAHILQVACDNGDGLPQMEEMLDEFVTFFIAGT